MFEMPKRASRRSRVSLLASFLVHCLVVYWWLNRPPIFVQPSSVAWGLHGSSENIIYFPAAPENKTVAKKLQLERKTKHKQLKEAVQNAVESARAGTPDGSLFHGPITGTEAMPALPTFFPDPDVYSWQLPNGLQGDVIVEVTIDERGNVTDTKVLQSLQPDVDDKVIATLRNWRFKPASVDGVAISSRQDVHFHFPS
jgi:TonB family protein